MTRSNRAYVHTLHLWDPHAPIPGLPVFSPNAVSFDDEDRAAFGVVFLAATVTVEGALVAHVRALADVVDASPDNSRVLIHHRDVMLAPPSGPTVDRQPVRWLDMDNRLIADSRGAVHVDVDFLVGGIGTREGAAPERRTGLHVPP